MGKWFLIKYEIYNGGCFAVDKALIKAADTDEVKEKLHKYIDSLNNGCFITDIFSVVEFEGDVFTAKFGSFK